MFLNIVDPTNGQLRFKEVPLVRFHKWQISLVRSVHGRKKPCRQALCGRVGIFWSSSLWNGMFFQSLQLEMLFPGTGALLLYLHFSWLLWSDLQRMIVTILFPSDGYRALMKWRPNSTPNCCICSMLSWYSGQGHGLVLAKAWARGSDKMVATIFVKYKVCPELSDYIYAWPLLTDSY